MVNWRPKDEDHIKNNFHSKALHRLSEMLMITRKNGKSWSGCLMRFGMHY